MNQLNQFIQQLRTLFVGMTPQSRLMAVLLTAGVAISSVFLVQGFTSGNGSMVYLFDGKSLSDDQLDRIEIAFSNSGLRKHERNGTRIRVPIASKDVYYKAISEGKAVPEGMGRAVDAALNSGNFLESTRITDAKQLRGKLQDLSNNIKQMPMIEDADVKYDEKREGFSAELKKTASVAVKTRGGKSLTAEQRNGIITYVAASFAGLRNFNVALINLSDSVTTMMANDPASIAQAQYYQVKRQREEELKQRAENFLIDYGNVRVDVNVDIDPTLSEETDILTYNDKPVTVQSTTTKKDATNQKFAQGGRPGTDPNVKSNQGASLSTPEQNNISKEQTENDKRVAGNTLTRTEKAGLQTTRVSFTVAVPFSYYKKNYDYQWQALNPGKPLSDAPALTEQELTKIRKETELSIQAKLTPIVPKGAAGEDKFPRVSVSDYPDMPIPEFPSPPMTQAALTWLSQSWQTIALMCMVGVALVSLRSFAKTTPSANDSEFERGFDLPLDDASDIDLSSLTDEESGMMVDQSSGEPTPPRLRTTGGDVKNDLTTLVRENPDAAATLLRNWIGGTN